MEDGTRFNLFSFLSSQKDVFIKKVLLCQEKDYVV